MFESIAAAFRAIRGFFSIHCSSEYQLKLEAYKYSLPLKTYNILFRVRSKPIVLEFDVKKLFFDAEMLKLMHPFDSYIVGIIYGMCQNQVQVPNNIIMDYFNEYASYQIMEPTLFVDVRYLDDDTDYIVLKSKLGNRTFRVNIPEICKKEFLLHGLGSLEACKLGFCISEKFIAEMI